VEAAPEVSSILAPITVTLEVPVTTTKISQLPMVVRSTVPLYVMETVVKAKLTKVVRKSNTARTMMVTEFNIADAVSATIIHAQALRQSANG
jgi:hypothetical protein